MLFSIVKCMRVCVVTDEKLQWCLRHTTSSSIISSCPAKTHRVSRSHPTRQRSKVVRHGRLSGVSKLVVVSEAAMEPQRIADLEHPLHHAESAALAAATRAALLDARQNEARAVGLLGIGKLQQVHPPRRRFSHAHFVSVLVPACCHSCSSAYSHLVTH